MADVEQTLFVCREVNVFRIPPRVGAGGYKSGDWKISDKLFSGRLKVMAVGDRCEIRLEDPATGAEFAVCPFGRKQRNIVVEQASDSSRNFVIRLEDRTSKRHAFVGLSFGDRSEAFDFNVALSDFDKHLERAEAVKAVAGSSEAAQSAPLPSAQDAALLYKKQDLSLRDGQTIKVAVKKPSDGGSFLSRLGAPPAGPSAGAGLGLPPPPPGGGFGLSPPPSTGAAWNSAPLAATAQGVHGVQHNQQQAAADPFATFLGGQESSQQQRQTQQPTATPQGWASFD